MSLILTRTQPLRTKYEGMLDKNEYRRSRYGAFDAFISDSNGTQSILTPQLKEFAKTSFGQTVAVPVMDADDVTISAARSCSWNKSENTSKLVQLTFATVSFGFRMYPSQYVNNDVQYQADFNKKLEKYLLKLAAHLDNLAYSTMNANKNKVYGADVTAIYAAVGDCLQVPTAGWDDFYNKIGAIMETMDFYGQYNVIANTLHQPIIRKYINQGTGNSTNLAFQFAGYDYYFSNRILNRTDGANPAKSTVFVVPQGNLAFVNRQDPDSLAGRKTGDGTEWSTIPMPIVNIEMGSTYKSYCANVATDLGGENVSGLTASATEEFSFHTDICFFTSYNSAPETKSGAIVKAELI